jgi:predicted porin
MGNTGGGSRAEFNWRMPHAVWYESPTWNGLQFSALASPGQNHAPDNSAFAYGDFNCTGSSPRGGGSGFPNATRGFNNLPTVNFPANEICSNGSFGNAFSGALTYNNGPFTAIAAAELHQGVNRNRNEFNADGTRIVLPNGQTVFGIGVKNEWAAKIGAGYKLKDVFGSLRLYAAYEILRRENTTSNFNERSRQGVYASATQAFGAWSISGTYAHAFSSPGSAAIGVLNNITSADAATIIGVAANGFDNSADLYAAGLRYQFSEWASWYLVGAYLRNGPGARYCLGASGHAYGLCGRDQFNQIVLGTPIKAISSGLTLDF